MINNKNDFLIIRNTPIFKTGFLTNRFVSLDVLEKTLECWDMCPVFIGHPTINGEQSSGKKESLLDKIIGFLLNSKIIENRLFSDIFIYKNKISSELAKGIENGTKYAVSVGFLTPDQNINRPREILPDHLAILKSGDEKPRCKLNEGCGINII